MDDVALWIFAYGSLMWDPGFAPVARHPARLAGWRRSFCMWSIHYRGTREAPGLVLALEAAEGEGCDGMALGIGPEGADAILAALRARELISDAYAEREVAVTLDDGRIVTALTYVIATDHPQYARDLAPDRQARVIAAAHGTRGPNRDYLDATLVHLAALGVQDDALSALAARVRQLTES